MLIWIVPLRCLFYLSFLSLFTRGGRLTRVGVGGLNWRDVLRSGGQGLEYSIQTVTTLGPVVFIALEIACRTCMLSLFEMFSFS